MPRLIQSRLSLLPTVFIKKIYILDDSLQVNVSIYLRSINGSEPTEVIDYVSSFLKFYYVHLFNVDDTNAIIDGSSPIYEFCNSYFRVEAPVDDGEEIGAVETIYESSGHNYSTFEFDFSAPTDSFYNQNDELVFEYSTLFNVYPTDLVPTISWVDAFDALRELFEDRDGVESYLDFTLFTFASALGVRGDGVLSLEEDDYEEAFIIKKILKNQNLGRITYEKVFLDGKINEDLITTYVYPGTDMVYNGEPIRSLGGTLYDDASIDYESIIAQITVLIGDSQLSSDDKSSIEMVLVTSSPATLLLNLNRLRQAWSSKSTATAAGQFYERFSTLLYSLNRSVKTSGRVIQRLFTNPKLIEKRYVELDSYDPESLISAQYSYDDSEILYDEYLMDRSYFTDSDSRGYVLDNGYFFLDYEKIMQTQTNLSQIYNVDIVEKIFGTDFTNGMLKLDYTNLYRYIAVSSLIDPWTIEYNEEDYEYRSLIQTTYAAADESSGEIDTAYPGWPKPYMAMGWELDVGDLYMQQSIGYPATGSGDYSFCNLRSINIAKDQGLYTSYFDHDYRLMGFNFGDYYSWIRAAEYNGVDADEISTDVGVYKVQAHLEDKTLECIYALTSSYMASSTGSFYSYVDVAGDFCNYNNLNGYFNDFFVEKATEMFAGSLPWEEAPLIYNIHLDMLLNTYNGSVEAIVEASRQTSVNISPANGTLEQLQDFAEKYEALYNDHYAPGGTIYDLVATLSDQTLSYSTYLIDLPDIMSAPEYDDTTEYAYVYFSSLINPQAYYTNFDTNYDATTLTGATLTLEELQQVLLDAAEEIVSADEIYLEWIDLQSTTSATVETTTNSIFNALLNFDGYGISGDGEYNSNYFANPAYSMEYQFAIWNKLVLMNSYYILDDIVDYCNNYTGEYSGKAAYLVDAITTFASYGFPNSTEQIGGVDGVKIRDLITAVWEE